MKVDVYKLFSTFVISPEKSFALILEIVLKKTQSVVFKRYLD